MSKNRRARGASLDLTELTDNDPQRYSDTASEFGAPASATEAANIAMNSQVGLQGLSVTHRAVPQPIDRIRPDITQPRRTLPTTIRQYWNGEPDFDSMNYLFNQWLREAELERHRPLDLDSYLLSNNTERAPAHTDENENELPIVHERFGHREAALIKIVDLAASILRDGLTNAITITSRHNQMDEFVIETGERRWLAFHLLRWHFGNLGPNRQDLTRIPARIVSRRDFWRQSSENNARDDLNAIAKARQLSLLLMDLHGWQHFREYADFEHDRHFYAQVADGDEWRIPRGMGERLVNALGFKNVVQLRQFRRLLRLPDIVWKIADDLDWTENFIQKNLISAKDEPELMGRAFEQAIIEDYSVSALTEYTDLVRAKKTPEITKHMFKTNESASRHLRWLEANIDRVKQARGEELERIMDRIRFVEERLRAIAEVVGTEHDLDRPYQN